MRSGHPRKLWHGCRCLGLYTAECAAFYCICYNIGYTRVKCLWHDIVIGKLLIGYEGSDGICSGKFHFFRYLFCTAFQGTLENSRESNNIINLIRKITTACADDFGTGFFCKVRHNLRSRISHGKENGVMVHGSNHLFCYNARSRYADKNISAF